MTKKALICGSMAFDNIMVFHDRFRNHILPDKVHILNVAFLVPEMRRETGGCAGNIAYNLKLMGGHPVIMATVGRDFEPYQAWLDQCGIDSSHISVIDNAFTAQAFITTDLDDNQITAFHPGAMSFAHENRVGQATEVAMGIVSPDGRDGMIEHAQQFKAAGIPFIFDPGQGLPMFSGDELLHFIDQATWVTLNDYEGELLCSRTGLTPSQIASRVEALIITKGGEGSQIYSGGEVITLPAVAVRSVVDPTGCGDAYRAGLIYGLLNRFDWLTTGRIAALLGGIKIEHHGTQNHHFTLEDFAHRYATTWGSELPAPPVN
jgi:adenosine kinase